VRLHRPADFGKRAIIPGIFAGAGLLCFVLSVWAAKGIERFSRLDVHRALADAGYAWADVQTDGLQVILTGTAPTEAMRFRALSVAGNVVDAARLRDEMAVADAAQIAPPQFSIEILRNGDGVSLIGLAPATTDRKQLVDSLRAAAADAPVTDMLESSDHEVPKGWDKAVAFAVTALKSLPRSKISIAANHVSITAISDTPEQKAALEAEMRRKAPSGLQLTLHISAPHPVIAPFTLRFLIDPAGARFDACSADSDEARARILAAGTAAGASAQSACTVGLGVPTPAWADAVALSLKVMKSIGHGSITFKDADIALIAEADVKQAVFDAAVGELESNLPPVFSLHATLTPKSAGGVVSGPVEFTATLSTDGQLALSGRLADELSRKAIDSFAQSRFAGKTIHAAIRQDSNLPEGWSARVLVALEALGTLNDGSLTVRADKIALHGTTGSADASGTVSRILSSGLGAGGNYELAIRYDKKLDPEAGLPTDKECIAQIDAALAAQKISFEPASAVISPESNVTLDAIAKTLKVCSDFPIEIGGHTDSQGREEMNLALSEQRARAVLVALQTRRVLTGNLTAVGYGETQPIEANNTEAGREKNRRIEFRLLTADAGPGATVPVTAGGASAGDIPVQTPDASTVHPKLRPDSTTPDASTPDASTPDATTPDTTVPDATAPDTSGDASGGPINND